MNYAELNTEGQVINYPLSIYQIRAQYSHISWPDTPDTESLLAFSMVVVHDVTPPTTTSKHESPTEITPTYNAITQQWEQTWVTEYAALAAAKAAERTYLADVRYAHEIEGCDYSYDGVTVPVNTDRDSQFKIFAAYVMVKDGLWIEGSGWKFNDGIFRPLSGYQVGELANTIISHVNGCFQREKDILEIINAAETIAEVEDWTWEVT
jgi:hypothetical protein